MLVLRKVKCVGILMRRRIELMQAIHSALEWGLEGEDNLSVFRALTSKRRI